MKDQLSVFFNCPPSPYYLEHGITYYKKGDSHPNRKRINLFDLIIVKQGTLALGEDEEEWLLEEGQTLLLLPDRYHYSVAPATTDTVFYWVHFQCVSEWIQTDQPHYNFQTEQHQECFNPTLYSMHIPKHIQLAYPQQVYELIDQMSESTQLLEPKAYWQKHYAFEQLLRILDKKQQASHASSLSRLAEQIEHFLRNHYRDPISNQQLSQQFNYHYNYITRAMKKVYGYSPHEYVTKLRLDQAKLMLLNTHQSISDISTHVGFDNIPYFANCFQKHVGVSPSNFRKKFAQSR